jgi:hypothetical protein
LDEAFNKVYGMGYAEILKIASDYEVDLTKKGS